MDYEFRTRYLVCFDCNDDVNYVVHRTKNLSKARQIAKLVKRKNPESDVYITVEKVCEGDAIGEDVGNICRCGHTLGHCIGDLSCRCSQYSVCKLTDTKRNPLDPYEDYGDDDVEEYEDEDEDDYEEELEANPYLNTPHGIGLEYDYSSPDRHNPDEDDDNPYTLPPTGKSLEYRFSDPFSRNPFGEEDEDEEEEDEEEGYEEDEDEDEEEEDEEEGYEEDEDEEEDYEEDEEDEEGDGIQ